MGSKRDRKTEENERRGGSVNSGKQVPSKESEEQNENPPRTTSKGWFTTPKFGSSTSGGGEIEPGPEKD